MPRKVAEPASRVGGGRHRKLLEDSKVRSWYDGRVLRSRVSADTYLRQLGLFVERLELQPNELVAVARSDPDRLRTLLTRLAARQKESKLLDAYIAKSFGGLRSWLEFCHVAFDGYPKLAPVKGQSIASERVPTPEELGRVLDRLSARGRVSALLMAHSGLRPGAIGSYGGADGLRLQDIPDLKLGKTPEFVANPFVIRVPAALSKTRAAYTTFGTSQLASSLLAYLSQRTERGERLMPASPVVAPAETRGIARKSQEAARFGKGFLTPKAIVEEIRESLQATTPEGVTWRPYVLRAYCSTRLMLAEGSGKISRDLREAILGHDGGVAARYNVGKRWGDELLKEARSAYKRCEPFLSTTPTKSGADEGVNKVLKALLVARGMSESEAAKMDLTEKSEDELKAIFGKFLSSAVSKPAQKAVPIGEVGALLAQGWEFVSRLDEQSAVVRSPG